MPSLWLLPWLLLLLGAVPPPAWANDCVLPPDGLVGFWPGDNNYFNYAATNHGTPVGGVTFAPGVVGQAFAFDGLQSAVNLGNPPALHLQNFTIETWVRRQSSSLTTLDAFPSAGILHYGFGGYGLIMLHDGRLGLTKVGEGSVLSTIAVADTNYHHIAVSKSDSEVVFFVDGNPESVGPYDVVFGFSSSLAIGARGDDWAHSFWGLIDEISIYNRPLSTGEIQALYAAGAAGKCKDPVIIAHPLSQLGFWGKAVTFEVNALGTETLHYQWAKDGAALAGETDAILSFTNLQMTNAGRYSVIVSNEFGTVESQPAILTMNPAGVSIALYAGVTIEGVVGFTYGIQNTTNLSDTNSWQGMANVTLGVPTQLWIDVQPATQPRRYYRVVPGPISIP